MNPGKYKRTYDEQAYELCLLGLTNDQLADHFEIDRATFYTWQSKYKSFADAIKKGKLQADGKVVRALLKRALGFRYDETTYEAIVIGNQENENIKIPANKKKVVTKLIPASVEAAALWLKNRHPELWRDREIDFSKLTDEQLDRIINALKSKAS